MSTLNLALQNVSLARGAMDAHLEAMVRHKTSLSQLRDAINRSSSLEVAFRDSMGPVIACLAGRFGHTSSFNGHTSILSSSTTF